MKSRAGRKSVADHAAALLLLQPRAYLDNTTVLTRIEHLSETDPGVIRLTVERSEMFGGAVRRLQIKFRDEGGQLVDCAVFGGFRQWADIKPGDVLLLRAKRGSYAGTMQLRSPELITTTAPVRTVYSPGWLEQDKGIKRVTGETLAKRIRAALRTHADDAVDLIQGAIGLPKDQITRLLGIRSLKGWLQAVHAPQDLRVAHAAQAVAKKIAILHAAAQAQQNAARPSTPRSRIRINFEQANRIFDHLASQGVVATNEQRSAVARTCELLASDTAMRTMLTGDVGTGKSLVFSVPAALAADAGEIVAILVPREILIEKTAKDIERLGVGVEVVRFYAGERLMRPVAGAVIVGTHALNGALAKAKLEPRFVIIDEQQKLAVQQRQASVREYTNVLEVSATPIPRSMALVQAGGVELLSLTEGPFRRKVLTVLLEPLQRKRLFAHLHEIAQHPTKQAAVIYPAIEGSESQSQKSKIAGTMALWEQHFPGRVAVLHGDLDRSQAEDALRRMNDGSAKILIATTALELGVTLPDLAAMVVIEPQRFALSTLHQLRGRLVRHGGLGRFFLLPLDHISETAAHRLQTLVQIENGFELAERDLAMRGAGDLAADSIEQDGDIRGVLPNVVVTARDIADNAAFIEEAMRALAR